MQIINPKNTNRLKIIENIQDYFFEKMRVSKRNHPIYILPTFDGIKLLSLNLILLIVGLIYANNYVLLFNFILFGLFLASMFYTHFNLQGISLKGIQSSSFFVNEPNSIIINLTSANNQDHFNIHCKIKHDFLSTNSQNIISKISSNHFDHFKFSTLIKKRGIHYIDHLYIETTFPLNLFKCFTLFKLQHKIMCFPEKIDFGYHVVSQGPDPLLHDYDEFYQKKYHIGDSLKRVNWKRVAKNNDWQTKFQHQLSFNNFYIDLNFKELGMEECEKLLSQASFEIYSKYRQKQSFGLKINDKIIREINSGEKHIFDCLQILALLKIENE